LASEWKAFDGALYRRVPHKETRPGPNVNGRHWQAKMLSIGGSRLRIALPRVLKPPGRITHSREETEDRQRQTELLEEFVDEYEQQKNFEMEIERWRRGERSTAPLIPRR
jgi:hypothetical protein